MQKISNQAGAKAVIELGSKQFLVKKGDRLKVEKLPQKPGDKIKVKDELADKTVTLTVGETLLERKIKILKFKPKTRYTKRKGHRQMKTAITVDDIG